MAREEASRVALLSIRPEFADSILRGEKRVEFRRRGFSASVQMVLIYSTRPVQRLVGCFSVSHVTAGSPTQIWRKFGDVGGISKPRFRSYYAGAEQAVAIGVGDLVVFRQPLELSALGRRTRPPQSFFYLSVATLQRLVRRSQRKHSTLTPFH